jgi:hypothetical protein
VFAIGEPLVERNGSERRILSQLLRGKSSDEERSTESKERNCCGEKKAMRGSKAH